MGPTRPNTKKHDATIIYIVHATISPFSHLKPEIIQVARPVVDLSQQAENFLLCLNNYSNLIIKLFCIKNTLKNHSNIFKCDLILKILSQDTQ